MEKLSMAEIMQSFLGERNFQNNVQLWVLQDNWDNIAGEILATHCQIEKVEGDTLSVTCDHAIFSQELQQQKETILKQINDTIGFQNINNLHCVIGIPHTPERVESKNLQKEEMLKALEKKYSRQEKEGKVLAKSAPNNTNSIDEIPENLDSDLKRLYEILVKNSS